MDTVKMVSLPYTPVAYQGKTPSCWAFSMASYWETEYYLSHGEWIHVSPWFFVYHKLIDSQQICLYGGDKERPLLPYGGLGHTALHLLQRHGYASTVEYKWDDNPQERYRNTYRTLKALTYLGYHVPFLKKMVIWLSRRILDARVPAIPQGHQPNGLDVNLIELTSFSHFPMHQDVILDVPDNIEHQSFCNLSLSELMNAIDFCLDHGHSLVWDGGIRGGDVLYNKKMGWAKVKRGVEVTEHLRSKYYQTQLTRDDHMLHIVGREKDEKGEVYYIAKDSSSEPGPYGGIIHLYRDFVRLKTISILMNKDLYKASIEK